MIPQYLFLSHHVSRHIGDLHALWQTALEAPVVFLYRLHGFDDLFRPVFAVVAHLGHYRFVALDTVGDSVSEVQLVVVADLGAVEVVESIDNLSQALFFGGVGLARALLGDRDEAVVAFGFFQAGRLSPRLVRL